MVHKRKVCRRSEMHSANASFIGSAPASTTEANVENQTDIYLLWSTVNSSSTILYSLVAGDNFAVEVPFHNVSPAVVDQHEITESTLGALNSTVALDFNLSNLTDLENVIGPIRDPYPTVILMTIVYAFILVTGVSGNLITCLVIARKRYMHTATNYYLFSLAVSDLLLLILGLPQDLVLLWQKYPYIFGESFCILRGLTSEVSTNASILTITAFTIERYVAICHPLRSHTTLKLARVVKTIVVIWIIAALCAAPIAYQFGIVYVMDDQQQPYAGSDHCAVKSLLFPYIFEIATMVFFVVPICIITILYILIGIRLRASSKGSSNSTGQRIKFNRPNRTFSGQKGQEGRHHLSMSIRRQNASRRAVIKMLVAVVISFFFCYSPFHAQRVLAIVMARNNVTEDGFIQIFTILTHISGVTYYLSSTINPILYQVMSKKFQLALRETLPCCKKFRDEHNDADVAFSTALGPNPPRQANSHSHSSKQASLYCSSSPKYCDQKS